MTPDATTAPALARQSRSRNLTSSLMAAAYHAPVTSVGPLVADLARRYVAAGFSIVPLWNPDDCAKGVCGESACRDDPYRRGKHPWSGIGVTQATTDLEVAETWFRDHKLNIGLVPGPGRVILDVDPRNGGSLEALGQLPRTPMAYSGASGWHVIFSYDGDNLSAANLPGVDLKAGASGYVVAAPSRHGLGGRYEWIVAPWQTEFAPLPRHLVDRLHPATTKPRRLAPGKTATAWTGRKIAEHPTRPIPKTAERRANGDAAGLLDQSRSGLLLSMAASFALAGWSCDEAEAYARKSDVLVSKLDEEPGDYFTRAIWPKAQQAERRVEAGWRAFETEDWSGRTGIRDKNAFAFCLHRFEDSWPKATISYRDVAKALGVTSAKTGGHALKSLVGRGLLRVARRGNPRFASTYLLSCKKEAEGTSNHTYKEDCIDKCSLRFPLPVQDAFLSNRGGIGPSLNANSAAIYQAILEQELTATEVAEAIGCHVRTARGHLVKLNRYGLAKRDKQGLWLGIAKDLEAVAEDRGTAGLGELRRNRLEAEQQAQRQFVNDHQPPANVDPATGEIREGR